ncbi:MAG: trypsin, partial [Flavobacteriia bacterium]|nr:trypsin [Flavobacteriia bacterium]
MVDNARQISTPLGMNRLKVDIQVVGNIAVTTLDMTFYSEEARVLEGELYFPLAAGQTVSRFAMEVDGKLREGVVVDKAQGRVAFESTVR